MFTSAQYYIMKYPKQIESGRMAERTDQCIRGGSPRSRYPTAVASTVWKSTPKYLNFNAIWLCYVLPFQSWRSSNVTTPIFWFIPSWCSRQVNFFHRTKIIVKRFLFIFSLNFETVRDSNRCKLRVRYLKLRWKWSQLSCDQNAQWDVMFSARR